MILAGGSGAMSKQSFLDTVGEKFGPVPQAASRLFALLATGSKTDDLTFERWLVGVYLFDEAGSSSARQTQLIFRMFEAKQVWVTLDGFWSAVVFVVLQMAFVHTCHVLLISHRMVSLNVVIWATSSS